ncbi:MAG TPA: twin-arginine translocation signal domain-containing protein [Vicinamibacterales bacterium]|jgi:hydrogenase small subunit|nr:twin-arginine translocation signal domain-containing protein [Vicinamibacterales bacterium]
MQRVPNLLPSAFQSGETGLSRRDFVRICTTAAAAVGLSGSAATRLAEAAFKLKPSVIWLHFQECTGCTESLLRTSHPAL